ncbi:MAG: hypothetical protein BWX44_01591 [Spirochaetes bacterium ADurb.Bin001]|nr:MAG: hypothetical protein BWX44_01591 [Spirochaetes bacterium ADurb.Bin001]
MRNDLGISFALKDITFFFKHCAKGLMVFDDAIVHHRNFAGYIRMRMGIGLCYTTMGRPSGVAYTPLAIQILWNFLCEFPDFSYCFDDLEVRFRISSSDCDSSRIIPSIFKSSESFKEDF